MHLLYHILDQQSCVRTHKTGLAHIRCFNYCRVVGTYYEIAVGANMYLFVDLNDEFESPKVILVANPLF